MDSISGKIIITSLDEWESFDLLLASLLINIPKKAKAKYLRILDNFSNIIYEINLSVEEILQRIVHNWLFPDKLNGLSLENEMSEESEAKRMKICHLNVKNIENIDLFQIPGNELRSSSFNMDIFSTNQEELIVKMDIKIKIEMIIKEENVIKIESKNVKKILDLNNTLSIKSTNNEDKTQNQGFVDILEYDILNFQTLQNIK